MRSRGDIMGRLMLMKDLNLASIDRGLATGNNMCVYMFQYLSTGSEYPSVITGDAELEEPKKNEKCQ